MDVEYLQQEVAGALEEGLAHVVKYQPEDSVEFLGQFLLKYVNNKREEKQVEVRRAAVQAARNAQAAQRAAQAAQQDVADKRMAELQALAEKVVAAAAAGTETEPDDLMQAVVDAVKTFTGASGVYLGVRDEPETEEEKLCVRYTHATEDQAEMLGQTLQDGEGVTFGVWKVPEKTEEEEEEEGEEGEEKKEKPPAFKPVSVPNVLLERQLKFFRRPAPGAFLAIPVRYTSTLYDGSISDAAIEAFNAEVATAKAAIAAAEAAAAEKAAAAAAAAEAAAEAGEGKGEDGEDGEDGEGGDGKAGEEGEEGEKEPEPPLPEIPRQPQVTGRKVDLVLCLDTLGQARPFTADEQAAAEKWAAWLGRALQDLEPKHVTEDWDALYEAQQANASRAEELSEHETKLAADLEERMNEIADDLADEARDLAVADASLWAAGRKVDTVASMIYEIRRRRVAPKGNPLKVLQAVVYLCGVPHSQISDPYARNKTAIAWKRMRMLFKSDLVRDMKAFTSESKPKNMAKIKGLLADLTVDDMRSASVAIAVLLEWAQAAVAAVAAKEDMDKAAKAAAEAAAEAAAAAAAAEEAEAADAAAE